MPLIGLLGADRKKSSASIFSDMGRKMSCTQFDLKSGHSFRIKSARMTKFVEFWGADKPFANINDEKMAKNIAIAVSIALQQNKKIIFF